MQRFAFSVSEYAAAGRKLRGKLFDPVHRQMLRQQGYVGRLESVDDELISHFAQLALRALDKQRRFAHTNRVNRTGAV